jgi:hypothetical protein
MDVACGDYARRGNEVFMDDGGDMGHEVMILSGGRGRYRVLSAAQEPGVTPDPGLIGQYFSGPPLLRSTAAKRRWRRGRPSRFCGHSAVSQVPSTAR